MFLNLVYMVWMGICLVWICQAGVERSAEEHVLRFDALTGYRFYAFKAAQTIPLPHLSHNNFQIIMGRMTGRFTSPEGYRGFRWSRSL